MIDEVALREVLVRLAEESKANHLLVSAMVSELAALREAVRGLDPTFSEVMTEKRREESVTGSPVEHDWLHWHDDMIQKLKAGDIC